MLSVPTGDSDNGLRELQIHDSELGPLVKYLEESELPTDQKLAKRIVAESVQFTVLDLSLIHI